MRTTITLEDDLYEAARALAESSGRTLSAVISELVRRGMQPREVIRGEDGLPAFDVPSDAKIIPATRAQELLAEEGTE